jgi:hypothetical protein
MAREAQVKRVDTSIESSLPARSCAFCVDTPTRLIRRAPRWADREIRDGRTLALLAVLAIYPSGRQLFFVRRPVTSEGRSHVPSAVAITNFVSSGTSGKLHLNTYSSPQAWHSKKVLTVPPDGRTGLCRASLRRTRSSAKAANPRPNGQPGVNFGISVSVSLA